MLFEIDINLVYLYLLQRYTVVFDDDKRKCNCVKLLQIPIPVYQDKNKITMNGTCCSFACMLNYLDNSNLMIYNYSFNILWSVLQFLIKQTDFI